VLALAIFTEALKIVSISAVAGHLYAIFMPPPAIPTHFIFAAA
jgi:hypothetical protein